MRRNRWTEKLEIVLVIQVENEIYLISYWTRIKNITI